MQLDSIKTDVEAAEQGVWVDVVDDFSIRVRRINYEPFVNFIQKTIHEDTQSEFSKVVGGSSSRFDSADDETLTAMIPAMAEGAGRHLISGWKGLQEEDGTEIAFSSEKAVEILTDPGHRDLVAFVVSKSRDAELFRVATQERHAGNS